MTTLTVTNLDVRFRTSNGQVDAVRDLYFSVGVRETLGLVGESGSGKSQAMLAILGLLAPNGEVSGSARLGDTELIGAPESVLGAVRGRRIGIVFQDPMQSLNPYLTVGQQLDLVLARHRPMAQGERRREIIAMLDAVRIPAPAGRLSVYPHELSGGMRQRVLIAMALLARPEILIADEPTTALDVTVQAGILALLADLRDAFGMGLVLISHDFGVIAGNADSMLVLEDGQVVESGTTSAVFASPQHPCTRRLLAAVPQLTADGRPDLAERDVLADIRALTVRYPFARRRAFDRRWFNAVRGVSLSLSRGETLGVVGESGSGKSSLAKAIVALVVAHNGEIRLQARDGTRLVPGRDVQMVFQDPLSSLNPRMRIGQIIEEPLRVHEPGLDAAGRTARVGSMLERVGLDAAHGNRYPHQFSGGQCQRIAIARALITRPALLVCDEAVSSLDVSVQADITDLLLTLQREDDLAILFIAHDLGVVRRVSHRLIVMYLGRVVESGPANAIYRAPTHPYTRALLAAAPVADPGVERARVHDGKAIDMPAPWAPPSGCAYRTRCAYAIDRCAAERPELAAIGGGIATACHRTGDDLFED